MIRMDKLGFSYGADGSGDEQLKDISLHVRRGEFILLTGKSGCGKTTLTRVINGLCPQFFPGRLTGQYLLEGRDAGKLSIDEIGTMVGSVFQDPRSQFFAVNTTDEIVLGMENNAVPRDEMTSRLKQTAAQIGVEHLLDRSIFPLSGGEKQRVAIASVCAMRPAVMVLDEPSANLDSDAIERLSVLLFRLKEAGATIILSEHRLHYVKDFFDRMILMEDGRLRAEYSRGEALALTEGQLTDMGLRLFNEPGPEPGKRMVDAPDAALRAHRLSLSFGGKRILDEADLSAQGGRILAVAGGNGAGKSSLCRVISGLQKPHAGQVFIGGRALKRKKRIQGSFFVQQDPDYQLYAATVEEEFHIGKKRKGPSGDRIAGILRQAGLEDMALRHPLSLSGGQKQRLLLAVAALSGRDILIFDEPTSGLDGGNMRLTARLLKELAASGKCVILVTHDTELISMAADSLLYMDKGRVSYHRALAPVSLRV